MHCNDEPILCVRFRQDLGQIRRLRADLEVDVPVLEIERVDGPLRQKPKGHSRGFTTRSVEDDRSDGRRNRVVGSEGECPRECLEVKMSLRGENTLYLAD